MRLGTITFQANDKADIFHVAEVIEQGQDISDEALLQIEDAQFDSSAAWVTGKVPVMTPVNIEGDNTMLRLWFKGENYADPFVIRVYVEFEEAEELVDVEPDLEEGRDQQEVRSEDQREIEQACDDDEEVNL